MGAAIKSTFPAANHRWCRWHVLRKTKQKLGPVYSKKSNFKKEFNKLVTEETMVNRFERKWRQLMCKYNLVENRFMKRIFKHRAKWAKPYFMGIYCAGMTSTQRSESANHMLKQFIQRSSLMHMFVRKFNEFQMDRNDQEEKEVYLTKQVCSPFSFFRTPFVYRIVEKQQNKVMLLTISNIHLLITRCVGSAALGCLLSATLN